MTYGLAADDPLPFLPALLRTALSFLLAWLAWSPAVAFGERQPVSLDESAGMPTIAIIIDDMGNRRDWGHRTIDLPHPLTLAFLPQRPYTRELAARAHLVGKEIMLHMPMENERALPLGGSALTSDMSAVQLETVLRDAIAAIPHLRGVNNHMGSRLTANPQAMQQVMQVLRGYPLYFIDSRTTAASVAYASAAAKGIPVMKRDVFLDHAVNYRDIHLQFQRLLDIARRNGTAIAIGHPHEETIRYLEHTLPKMGEQRINIATVSGLWQVRHGTLPEHKPGSPALELVDASR